MRTTVGMGPIDVNADDAYLVSFGNTRNKTVYSGYVNYGLQGPLNFSSDIKSTIGKTVATSALKTKAYTSTIGTGATNAGQVLVPVWVDEDMTDLTRIDTPLVNIIPRVTNRGLTADWNQISAIASGTFLAEDAALPDQDDSFVRQFTPIKFGYAIGRVTGVLQAGAAGFIDAMGPAVRNKTLALKRLEENTIINGDVSSDPNEYDGLIVNITAGGSGNQNLAGAGVTLDNIMSSLTSAYNNGGLPNLIVTDAATLQAIRALMLDQFRYVNTVEIAWGIKVVAFETHMGTVPVMPDRFMPAGAGVKALMVLDLSVIEMRVLQDVTMELLAKTNDSQKFFLKVYEALVVKAPQFNSLIFNIL